MKKKDAENAILYSQLECAYKILKDVNEQSNRKFNICQQLLRWLNEITLKVYYDEEDIKK
jgi:hypothetical protein